MWHFFFFSVCKKSDHMTLKRLGFLFKHKKSYFNHEGARHCRKPLGRQSVTKGPIYRFFELVTTALFNCANSLGKNSTYIWGNGNNANIFPRISVL